MQFSDRIQMENNLFHLYKLYGLTSRAAPPTPVRRAVIFILSPLNEVQFCDRLEWKMALSICTNRMDRQALSPP